MASVADDTHHLGSLVVVTEDLCPFMNKDGCDAISVFDIEMTLPVFSGTMMPSPGRLAATSDLSTILAINSNYAPVPFLYYAHRQSVTQRLWLTRRLGGPNFATSGGIALAPDDATLLVATVAFSGHGGGVERGPYAIEKYLLSELGVDRVGPRRGSITVPGRPAEIIPTADGHYAHIFTVTGQVLTIDIVTMREVAATVQAGPLVYGGIEAARLPAAYGHATISPDSRYLIANRWATSEVSVVDLVNRSAAIIDVPFSPTGGVAFSYGPHNTGLLAVHGLRRVGVFEFQPPTVLREVARAAVTPPEIPVLDTIQGGPYASVAWSGDGSHLIVATDRETAEFQLFHVDGVRGRISPRQRWAACTYPSDRNAANDILTINRPLLPSPTPTATASSSATYEPTTATPTLTVTSIPTVLPTATSSSTAPASPTATALPGPLYLPIALREKCIPGQQHTDVALVIDASTSMRDQPISTGRRKLDAAQEAVALFVGQLDLAGGDQAAIVQFNADAAVLSPLTTDRAALERALSTIEVARQTRIQSGIHLAREELTSARHRAVNNRAMVVLTDGANNPEPVSEAEREAALARADGMRVFTVGLGIEVEGDALARMATSAADYFYAPDGEDLAAIYQRIAHAIPCPPESFWGRR